MSWEEIWTNTLFAKVESFCVLRVSVCVPAQHLCVQQCPVLSRRLSFVLAPSRPAAALMECRLFPAHLRHSSLMRKLAGTRHVLQMLTERRARCLCGFIYFIYVNLGGINAGRAHKDRFWSALDHTRHYQLKKTQRPTPVNTVLASSSLHGPDWYSTHFYWLW